MKQYHDLSNLYNDINANRIERLIKMTLDVLNDNPVPLSYKMRASNVTIIDELALRKAGFTEDEIVDALSTSINDINFKVFYFPKCSYTYSHIAYKYKFKTDDKESDIITYYLGVEADTLFVVLSMITSYIKVYLSNIGEYDVKSHDLLEPNTICAKVSDINTIITTVQIADDILNLKYSDRDEIVKVLQKIYPTSDLRELNLCYDYAITDNDPGDYNQLLRDIVLND